MKKFNFEKLLIAILGILLLSVSIYAVQKEKEKVGKEIVEKVVYVGYDTQEPVDNFSRSNAVSSLTAILRNVGVDKDNKERTVIERLELLDNKDTDIEDVLVKEAIEGLYLSEDFGDLLFNRQFVASGLLVYHQVIEDASEEIKPLIEEGYEDLVYFDSEMMTAHIPLDIYVGSSTGIAFEMVYIDGEWKLNPYTAMMSLHLTGIIDGEN